MDEKEQKHIVDTASRIEKQVLRWDLYAKLAPTIFLLVCFILLAFNLVGFDVLFWVGITLFSFTAVVWWFWTIFSIRFLLKTLSRASSGLVDVSNDLKQVKKDFLGEE